MWDLCRFRRGPQDLPYSPALARGLVLADAGASLLYLEIVGAGKGGVAQLAVAMLVAVLTPLVLLRSRGLGERYVQTLSALFGTSLLLTLLYLPVGYLSIGMAAIDVEAGPTRQQLAVGWLTLALVAWKLTIGGHIWRQAMNWPLLAGIAVALGILMVQIGLQQLLFGA